MEIIKTEFKDLFLFKPRVFQDSRGYFYESYNRQVLLHAGISYDFVQDNQSESAFGVIRGLHYQLAPYAQAKLVRVIAGEVFDVAVDLRPGSSTFGEWYGILLSGDNKFQLLIPQGFAHGFSVLSDKAVVVYKTDAFYDRESERGIVYNDKSLNIDWKLAPGDVIVSDKDRCLPAFKQLDTHSITGHL
jgi:dTDP-4-dehydrorhamnose 3,5-epimerase